MTNPTNPIKKLLDDDPRYPLEAYQFVREGLAYAHNVLNMAGDGQDPTLLETQAERHLTGQQLCEAIREYAVEQYGYMARTVLGNWGLHSTSDFGDVVYNLINVGLMKQSKEDRREDFNDVYDFDQVFGEDFRITPADEDE